MASEKAYLCYVLDQVSSLDEVSYRAMMGEYVLYVDGKVVGGLYDDRLLVKPTPSAKELMPQAVMERPYPGAKELLRVDEVDDGEFLSALLRAVAADGCVAEPTSGDFLSRHGFRSHSTVRSALADLVNTDLLYRSDNGYVVYDRLFGIWLRGNAYVVYVRTTP